MLWNDIRNLAISIILGFGGVLCAHEAVAGNIGDDGYLSPTIVQEIGEEHHEKMMAIEQEYKKRLAPYSAEAVQIREMEADLKEARMVRRDELEDQLMADKERLYKIEYERINPYILKKKARKRFFEKKKENELMEQLY